MRTSEERRRTRAVYRTSIGSRAAAHPNPWGRGLAPVARGWCQEAKKEKDIRWSGCPSPPTPRGRGLCWDVSGPHWRPARIRAARTRLHESSIRWARCDCLAATARAGLRPVDATSSAPGARASGLRNGPSARPRMARWITARDECHVRPPFRTGAGWSARLIWPRRLTANDEPIRTLRLVRPAVKRIHTGHGDILECRTIRRPATR